MVSLGFTQEGFSFASLPIYYYESAARGSEFSNTSRYCLALELSEDQSELSSRLNVEIIVRLYGPRRCGVSFDACLSSGSAWQHGLEKWFSCGLVGGAVVLGPCSLLTTFELTSHTMARCRRDAIVAGAPSHDPSEHSIPSHPAPPPPAPFATRPLGCKRH